MINENEIRIGNWFHHTQQWSTMQGNDTLNYFDFKWTSSNWYQIGECLLSFEVLEPITLDEDWLLRFGFEKYEFDNGEPNQYRYNNRLIVIRDGKFTDYGSSVMLEYVHQLQNFYFALVGKELVLQD